jgi:hypothetical protein
VGHKIAIAFLLALVTCATAQIASRKKDEVVPAERSCDLTENDYAVYTALLEGLGRPEDPEEAWRGKESLVVDKTADTRRIDAERGGWGFRSSSKESPSAEAVADFKAKRGDRCPVKSGFGDPSTYSMIPADEIDRYFARSEDEKRRGDGWKGFYENHPNAAGFWQFSQPAYNSAGDEAIVYVSHSCGGLCGTGHLYLLSRRSGVWKTTNRLMLWIS